MSPMKGFRLEGFRWTASSPTDLHSRQHNNRVVLVLPAYRSNGTLPPGIHLADWPEIVQRFGKTPKRRRLLKGLKAALANLKAPGCSMAYLDGSFVTGKGNPRDFDGCWDTRGVDPTLLDPLFIDQADLEDGRRKQKLKYRGELVPTGEVERSSGVRFLGFFQLDTRGDPKGIVAIDLRTFQP